MEGLDLYWHALLLLPAAPVAWLSALVRHSDDADFVRCQQIDDAVREASHWHTTTLVPPTCTQLGVRAKNFYRALELGNESQAKLIVGLRGVAASAFNQLMLRFCGN